MIKFKRILTVIITVLMLVSVCGCSTNKGSDVYPKEDAAGTGYGTNQKSALYIEDFYFLTVGTEKSAVDMTAGSAHYHSENNDLMPVYTLANGDSIAIVFDDEKKTVKSAVYTYSEDMEKESFFDILVELEILQSAGQETPGETNTDIQQQRPNGNDSTLPPSSSTGQTNEQLVQQVTQGEVFASGTYNPTITLPLLKLNMTRTDVLSAIGKPNYFFSHNFKADTYIFDCYNLNDGSKLYLDYGFERTNLRCAAIYKNGTVTSLLDTPWSEQKMPSGFTRLVSDVARVNRLTKNMTPAKVYAYIGEPCWYEGTRGSYTDVFKLSDGSYAYLNFGSAHNKLTSLSIKGADGSVTVLKLK